GSGGLASRMDRPLEGGDRNGERVVADARVPVLVDFYADWCAPCKMMAPILDEVAHDRAGSLLVTKLDTDRNPTMAVRYSIRGIPTLILFHEGREVGRQTGAVPRAQLESWIDAAVGAGEA